MNTNQEQLRSIEQNIRMRQTELERAAKNYDAMFLHMFEAMTMQNKDVQANMTNIASEDITAQNPDVQADMTEIAKQHYEQPPVVTTTPWVNQEQITTARNGVEEALDTRTTMYPETTRHDSPSAVTSSDANHEVARLTELAKQIQRDNDNINPELLA